MLVVNQYILPDASFIFARHLSLASNVLGNAVDIVVSINCFLCEILIIKVQIRVAMTLWGEENRGMKV